MKKLILSLTAGLVCCALSGRAQEHEYKEHISKAFTLPPSANNVLALYNLSGAVNIQGYDGDKVMIEVDERLSAKTDEQLEAGKKEFRLAIEQTADSILVYIAEPIDTRPRRHCCNEDNRQINYDFQLQFTVKVPFNIKLDVSTINDGDVNVRDVTGALNVRNINGAISIKNAKGVTRAHTINGNLTVDYTSVPPGESEYYTLNGTLTVTYPSSLSADLEFKSMNGDFFTDFDNMQLLPARLVKNETKNDGGTHFKLEANRLVRIGNGGTLFHFQTLNGNIYIKNSAKTSI